MSDKIKQDEKANQDDVSIEINEQGLRLSFPGVKCRDSIVLCIVWIVFGIVILGGVYGVFFIGGSEISQVKSLIPIEILHYYLILKIVCVLAMCFSLLGLYAFYCHFSHCMAREDGRIKGMRRDVLLKAIELQGKMVAKKISKIERT